MKKYAGLIFLLLCLCCTAAADGQSITGTYAIKNVHTGMLLRIKDAGKANGTPLVSYNPVNWKCMTWDFRQTENNTYQLVNLFSGKTFQPRAAAAAGVPMEEQPLLAGNEQQQYEFIAAGKNSYLIRLKNTGLYITPADDKGMVNGAIVLAPKSNSQLQLWTLYEQHPSF